MKRVFHYLRKLVHTIACCPCRVFAATFSAVTKVFHACAYCSNGVRSKSEHKIQNRSMSDFATKARSSGAHEQKDPVNLFANSKTSQQAPRLSNMQGFTPYMGNMQGASVFLKSSANMKQTPCLIEAQQQAPRLSNMQGFTPYMGNTQGVDASCMKISPVMQAPRLGDM